MNYGNPGTQAEAVQPDRRRRRAEFGSMAAAGFGISFCMPAATSAVVEAAPPDRGGIASGALNASRQVGAALGIALLGSFIAAAHGLGATLSGARLAMIVAGVAYVVGLALAVSMPRVAGPPST
ncbi:MAG TPA: hypothetical protein VE132_02855 [Micromonosporaceae bacterium]|jgi:DHA2 family methylenomycin A resistance protein-like MFS transporter|nr:hypothetical protein [Micromonosporaceae bacterium]